MLQDCACSRLNCFKVSETVIYSGNKDLSTEVHVLSAVSNLCLAYLSFPFGVCLKGLCCTSLKCCILTLFFHSCFSSCLLFCYLCRVVWASLDQLIAEKRYKGELNFVLWDAKEQRGAQFLFVLFFFYSVTTVAIHFAAVEFGCT